MIYKIIIVNLKLKIFVTVKKIKSILPDACIGVDVIVGFPGENDDYFKETNDFLDSLDISYIHVFSYSMRDNTDAIKIKDKIPHEIIAERSKTLNQMSMLKKRHFYEKNIGSLKLVLIEYYEDGFLYGHSENYISVRISGRPNEVNQIVPVKLIHIEDDEMIGERQG